MEIFSLNVGQGNLTVICNRTRAIIVDANIPAKDRGNEFVRGALSQVLRRDGRPLFVEGLLLTGHDKDHANARGVQMVLRHYLHRHPRWVVYPDYRAETENFREVMQAIRHAHQRGNVRVVPISLESQVRHWESTGFCFEFFSPYDDRSPSSNDKSIVVRVMSRDGSPGSVLITGDVGVPRWKEIDQYFAPKLKSDVMIAPHHGSVTGVHEQTLAWIRPRVVHISAGVNLRYQHPHPEAVELYQRYADEVRCTQDGTIWSRVSRTRRGTEISTRHIDISPTRDRLTPRTAGASGRPASTRARPARRSAARIAPRTRYSPR